jgi:hypothetical protein
LAVELETVFALIDRMVAKGVRRLRWGELELELDPAAQIINAPPVESTPAEDPAKKAAEGLCAGSGCTERGGWLNTAYCRTHFKAGLNAGN